jgi:hypothetical protein
MKHARTRSRCMHGERVVLALNKWAGLQTTHLPPFLITSKLMHASTNWYSYLATMHLTWNVTNSKTKWNWANSTCVVIASWFVRTKKLWPPRYISFASLPASHVVVMDQRHRMGRPTRGVAPPASRAFSDARPGKANHGDIALAAIMAGDIIGWGEKER